METFFIKYKKSSRINVRILLCFILLSMIHFSASAQESVPGVDSVFFNYLFDVLLGIIILLLIAIIIFSDLVKAGVEYKSRKGKEKKGSSILKAVIIVFAVGSFSTPLHAQTAVAQAVHSTYLGLDEYTFFTMLSIIALEIFIIWMLYRVAMQLLGIEERESKKAEEKIKAGIKQQPSFIEKLNASIAIEEESEIMLDHNYDGIRELDNDLPPWWKYGFYLTIVIAVIYLFHFHVIKTGKLQQAEYEDQLTKAKSDMEEYRKKAANLIDENNATLLSDGESLAAGKSVFMDNCSACHGRAGEGGVGPNLTDAYWLHKGGIKDIFKTIKYGWPEKGMKSWQQDLGAKQIHEVASYIKSLYGTNPPNAKEKQGDLYSDEKSNDSTHVIVNDSLPVVLKSKEE